MATFPKQLHPQIKYVEPNGETATDELEELQKFIDGILATVSSTGGFNSSGKHQLFSGKKTVNANCLPSNGKLNIFKFKQGR